MDAPIAIATYEVVRMLGEGGIGRVYEAVHRPSGRHVALKTLRSEHGGPTSQRLLLNEASAVAQISHPSIVELLDVGRDDSGAMFLVMELVRGSNLEAWSKSVPGLRTVLRATCDIMDALSTAHAQGIVHGDLKPANVLLTEDGHVKITDFGIAHVVDPLRAPDRRRGVQGTPYYMAPEQLSDLPAIGPPSDLYAMGVILYELLSGREPYQQGGTLGELLARKVVPVAPLELRAGLSASPELAALVMSLLDPDPRLRPRFAAAVRAALTPMLEMVDDEPPSTARPDDPKTIATAPTISSADDITMHPGHETSARSLPFSLFSTTTTPDASLVRLRPLPMLGRSDEADRLLSLSVASRFGARGLVVTGRAGEGKTRLVRHGFSEVERTGTMLGIAASFDETIANEEVGMRACMRRLVGAPARTTGETLGTRWRWLVGREQPGVDFDLVHDWLSSSRPFKQELAVSAATMCVRAASRVYPIYLWLDDAAWSRDGAMDLMIKVLEENVSRVLVVATVRSGTTDHPVVSDWLGRVRAAGAEMMTLHTLPESDRVALLRAAGPLSAPLATALAAKLDEPPLILVEAVRAWIAADLLVRSGEEYVLRPDTSVDALAERVGASVVGGRVRALVETFGPDGDQAERVLCHAALLGLRFDERALRLCAPARVLDRVLDRALLTGLLRVDGRGGYRFEHRSFLDVIVGRCAARSDAADVFRATGDALVAAYGRRSPDTALAAAALYQGGGATERAVRVAADGIRALHRVAARGGAARALALVTTWIEALPRSDLRDLCMAIRERVIGVGHYFKLDYPTARKHLHAAREVFERLGATSDLQDVWIDLSSTHFYQDHFAESERYIRLVDQSRATWWARSLTSQRLSELAFLRLDVPAAIAHEREARSVDDPEMEKHFRALSVSTLLELLVAGGDMEAAAAEAASLVDLLKDIHDRAWIADAGRAIAVFDAGRGDFAAARARLEPRVDLLRARDDPWHLTSDLAVLAYAAAVDADEPHVTSAVRAFVTAFTSVPHDEASTWWSVRCAQAMLRARGLDGLANEIGTVIDARQAQIALAFEDDEPVTEDAEVR